MKKLIIFILAIGILFVTGCTDKQTNKDLWTVNMNSSMGGAGDNFDKQIYSYQIIVSREDNKLPSGDFHVEEIISEQFKNIILEHNRHGTPDKELPTLYINGEIILDTKGLNKQQIDDLGQVIKGVKVNWTENGNSCEYVRNFQW